MKVLGMISGTSHDGIDTAVVDFVHTAGVLSGTVLHTGSTPYPAELRTRLIEALPPAATTMAEVCELDTLIGQAFAEAAGAVLDVTGPIDLICSHGQTVYHWVREGAALGTLQLGQPAWIAEATGTAVVSDVRIRDLTVGGQGAPLVSFLDRLLLAGVPGTRAALNLGGIANMTVIGPDGQLVAYDIGPANALIDAVVVERGLASCGYDRDGAIAASGTVDETLLAALLDEPYYRLPAPKTTGKELFHGSYVRAVLDRSGADPSDADLVATFTELTVRTVAADVRRAGVTTLVASGGGCRNPVILDGLRAALPGVDVTLTDAFGAPSDEKEAIAFALIGWCTVHGVAATLPAGTGAREPRILGTITPGAGPLQLPAPLGAGPTALVLRPGRG